MNNQGMNLFIVDDNQLVLLQLRIYLQNRFGTGINISTFSDGQSALKKIDKDTGIVILDYYLEGENGNQILKSIKAINPKTEVIMHSSNEDVAIAIESFRSGASDFVVKGNKSQKKLNSIILKILTYPIRIMVREFGISKYLAIFLMSFVTMGIVVACFIKYWH